jgi:hypothetical protein
MATSGERFKMPDGSVYIVRRAAAETDGESVEMEFVLPARCVPRRPTSILSRWRNAKLWRDASTWWWRAIGARSRLASQPRCRSVPFTRSGITLVGWSACATGTGRPCASRTSSSAPAARFGLQASSESAIHASFSIYRWSCSSSTTRSSQGEGGSGFRCRLSRALRDCSPLRPHEPNRPQRRTNLSSGPDATRPKRRCSFDQRVSTGPGLTPATDGKGLSGGRSVMVAPGLGSGARRGLGAGRRGRPFPVPCWQGFGSTGAKRTLRVRGGWLWKRARLLLSGTAARGVGARRSPGRGYT